MKKSARKTAVIAFCVGVIVALAAYAGTEAWFEATGTATTSDTNTQLDQHRLHFTSGADNIQFRGGNDSLNFGDGYDSVYFGGTTETEKITFDTDANARIWYYCGDEELDVASEGDVVITIGAGQ